MTGAAAGLAAAFNTPLGGIVFAIEELTKTHISYFRTALFTAVIIAGLTAQALFGPYLYLGYPVIKGLSIYISPGRHSGCHLCRYRGKHYRPYSYNHHQLEKAFDKKETTDDICSHSAG